MAGEDVCSLTRAIFARVCFRCRSDIVSIDNSSVTDSKEEEHRATVTAPARRASRQHQPCAGRVVPHRPTAQPHHGSSPRAGGIQVPVILDRLRHVLLEVRIKIAWLAMGHDIFHNTLSR